MRSQTANSGGTTSTRLSCGRCSRALKASLGPGWTRLSASPNSSSSWAGRSAKLNSSKEKVSMAMLPKKYMRMFHPLNQTSAGSQPRTRRPRKESKCSKFEMLGSSVRSSVFTASFSKRLRAQTLRFTPKTYLIYNSAEIPNNFKERNLSLRICNLICLLSDPNCVRADLASRTGPIQLSRP